MALHSVRWRMHKIENFRTCCSSYQPYPEASSIKEILTSQILQTLDHPCYSRRPFHPKSDRLRYSILIVPSLRSSRLHGGWSRSRTVTVKGRLQTKRIPLQAMKGKQCLRRLVRKSWLRQLGKRALRQWMPERRRPGLALELHHYMSLSTIATVLQWSHRRYPPPLASCSPRHASGRLGYACRVCGNVDDYGDADVRLKYCASAGDWDSDCIPRTASA